MMATTFHDYYATLGVVRTATEKEVKSAFRKLARQYHPDVNPGNKEAEAKFKEITEAYEVLGDPEKRKKYDELGPRWQEHEAWEKAGRPGGSRPAAAPTSSTGPCPQRSLRASSDGPRPFPTSSSTSSVTGGRGRRTPDGPGRGARRAPRERRGG